MPSDQRIRFHHYQRAAPSRLRQAISHLAESWARWGLTFRFSATRALRDLVANRSSSARSNSTRQIVRAQC
jgi:hypothetical protein